MSDYISRQAALDALGVTKNATKYGGDHSGYDTRMLYEIHDALTGIPAADVAPVVHGKWMPQKGGGLCCSECNGYALDEPDGNFIHVAVSSKFCPHCGAKMDGEE